MDDDNCASYSPEVSYDADTSYDNNDYGNTNDSVENNYESNITLEVPTTDYYSSRADEKPDDESRNIFGYSSTENEKYESNKEKTDESSGFEYVKNLANSIWRKADSPTPPVDYEVNDYILEAVVENDCEYAEDVDETIFADEVADYPVQSRSFVKPRVEKIDNIQSYKKAAKADSHNKMKLSTVDKITVFLAELIGTALLVFLGCMGCIEAEGIPNNHLQMTFNFGLVIMIVVQCFGCVSGAHFNPAVTVAATVYKLITPAVAVIYVVAQLLGSFIGYGLLKALVPSNVIRPLNAADDVHGLCVTTTKNGINIYQGLGIEFVLTTVLILLCCGVWDPRNAKHHDSVAIKFGLAVASLAITGGPFTGASMNPARSFGPALWNADFHDHWIYWVGPLVAGAIASIAYKAVFRREVTAEKDAKLRAMEELPLR